MKYIKTYESKEEPYCVDHMNKNDMWYLHYTLDELAELNIPVKIYDGDKLEWRKSPGYFLVVYKEDDRVPFGCTEHVDDEVIEVYGEVFATSYDDLILRIATDKYGI